MIKNGDNFKMLPATVAQTLVDLFAKPTPPPPPETHVGGTHQMTAEEVAAYPVRYGEYRFNTKSAARRSLESAKNQFAKGWLTQGEYAFILGMARRSGHYSP